MERFVTTASRPEHLRSNPDFIVFLPNPNDPSEHENQHFNVVVTPEGTFLAFWTQGSRESDPDQRTVMSRSTDRGRTWSPYVVIDGPTPDDDPGVGLASWEFPIIAPGVLPDGGTRIWCFYTKNIGIQDVRTADTGVMRARWSDDDGLTWSEQTHDFPIPKTAIAHPDPKVPSTWIVYQTPRPTPEGAILAPFTHWASRAYDTETHMLMLTSESWFFRFENILTESDPDRIEMTLWPRTPDGRYDHGIRVLSPERPGISVCQEPTVCTLSNGRLVCVMRTYTGEIWFSTSDDDGRTWSEADVLRQEPGGAPLLNPVAPCPMYPLSDGRFLLVFYNNDGTVNGGNGPADGKKNRTPAWYTVGVETDDAHQPIRFGEPRVLLSNDCVVAGPSGRTEIASYPSFFEYDGTRYFWYPDRKHFLLGKIITDEMLDAVTPR